jgi:hypothetical protein
MVKSSIPENRENLISIMHSDEQHAKDQEERKPIDSEKMARIVNLYTESDTFKKPMGKKAYLKTLKTIAGE